MADERDETQTVTAGDGGRDGSSGGEALDWTKPLEDPKAEKIRQTMVRELNRKTQEIAEQRNLLGEERAALKQSVEDELLEEYGPQFEALAAGRKPASDKSDEEMTPEQELRKELKEVKDQFGSLQQAFQQVNVQREADRIVGEINRAMDKHPDVFPPSETEDEQEIALRNQLVDDVAREYATSGAARARKPIAPIVKKVADRVVYIRTRGKTVKSGTGEGEGRRPRPEGDGGEVAIPDDVQKMGLGDSNFVERLIATVK